MSMTIQTIDESEMELKIEFDQEEDDDEAIDDRLKIVNPLKDLNNNEQPHCTYIKAQIRTSTNHHLERERFKNIGVMLRRLSDEFVK
jgi:hypothetical protein